MIISRHGPRRAHRGRGHAVAAAGSATTAAPVSSSATAPARRSFPSGSTGPPRPPVVFGSDIRGIHMARREMPGYPIYNGACRATPGSAWTARSCSGLATELFSDVIRQTIAKSGWTAEETRWVVPHQANTRILKAAAKRSGVPSTASSSTWKHRQHLSASIPLALIDADPAMKPGDKVILCSVAPGPVWRPWRWSGKAAKPLWARPKNHFRLRCPNRMYSSRSVVRSFHHGGA